jgi:hypothetical protein
LSSGYGVRSNIITCTSQPTKDLFTAGCVYVKPTVESIRDEIQKAIAQYEDNLKAIVELRGDLEKNGIVQ